MIWLDSGVKLFTNVADGGGGSRGGGRGGAGAADFFLERALRAAALGGGVLSDPTPGTLERYTHPDMLSYFQKRWGYNSSMFLAASPPLSNCNGAFSAFSASGDKAATALDMWRACALDSRCICPAGSGKGMG